MGSVPSAQRQPSKGWALAMTSIAFFMVTLDTLVVVTVLPSIQHEFKTTISVLDWTVNAYTLTCAAGVITAAALGDRHGRRRLFVVGLALFTVASVACALAPDTQLLIAGRAVQGLGAAIVMPLSLTILTGAFPAERRGTVVGVWGGIAGLAVASGPLIGGAVAQGLDWHWIFWVNVPVGLVAVVLSGRRLPESRGPATELDLPGVGLVSGGAVGVVWGLVRANEAGWGSVETIVTLCLGIVLLIAFLAWERKAAAPMLPLRLFGKRAFAAASTTAFLMNASLFAAVFMASQYVQLALGYSPLTAGLRFLPWTATPLLVAPAAGILSDRIGPRPIMATGMLLQGLGLFWFAAEATATASYGDFVLALVVAGIGVSMVLPTAPAAALSAVAPADMGKASGTNSTLQRFGSAFGVAIAAAIFAANGHMGTPASFTDGFRPALAFAAGLSVLGAATALAVGQRMRKPAVTQSDLPTPTYETL